MSATQRISVVDKDAIRLVRMNRPDKKNALDNAMYDAFADALESAAAREDLRCIVIAGAPGAFCAGNDLADFQAMARTGTGLDAAIMRFLHALAACEKPLVAAVDGVAVGIGTTMLLHCDFVVASPEARFSTPFAQLGLVPEAASSLLAPRLMGQRRAFALLVMGRRLGAQEALASGLINVIAAPGQTDNEALKAAHDIAALPAGAVLAARRLMRGKTQDLHSRIDDEGDVFRERLRSQEAQAAFAAFFSRKAGS